MVAILLVSCWLMAWPAAGQLEPLTAEPAGPAAALEGPRLDWPTARRAHRWVERWVAAGEEQPELADDVPRLRAADAVGVRITLRSDGLVVGRGTAWVDPNQPRGPDDFTDLLTSATGQAVTSLRESLRHAQVRAAVRLDDDAPREGVSLRQVGREVMVGLQVARQPEPIRLAANAPPGSVLGSFVGGYHGVRMSSPLTDGPSVVWPADAVAFNLTPDQVVTRLLTRQGYRVDDLDTVARPGGPTLERFEVVHAVRYDRDRPILELVRGEQPLPPHTVNGPTLEELSLRLANHLDRRIIQVRDRGTVVRGEYEPSTGRYESAVAGDAEAALAIYALIRHAGAAGPNADARTQQQLDRAVDAAGALARRLASAGDQTVDAQALSLVLLSIADAPLAVADDAVRDALARRLLDLRVEGLWHDGRGRHVQPTTGVAAAAMTALHEATGRPQYADAALGAVQSLWDRTGGRPDLSALPWLMMVHTRLTPLVEDRLDQTQAMALAERRDGMAGVIRRLQDLQVVAPPRVGPPDVVGGIVLRPGPPGAPPNPTWSTAGTLSAIALGARDPLITGPDAMGTILSAGLAARFLAQLTISPAGAWFAVSPPDAIGGVRLAPWDHTLPVAPTAMTLLAVTQLQETLSEMSASAE
jgi:hypothetical protein